MLVQHPSTDRTIFPVLVNLGGVGTMYQTLLWIPPLSYDIEQKKDVSHWKWLATSPHHHHHHHYRHFFRIY